MKAKPETVKPTVKMLTRQELYNQNKHINLQTLSKELAHGSLVEINLFKELLKECSRITSTTYISRQRAEYDRVN